jgi:ketosteroid isomerase-like protein
VETPKCDVFRFRQGKVVSFMEFYDTARALEATR